MRLGQARPAESVDDDDDGARDVSPGLTFFSPTLPSLPAGAGGGRGGGGIKGGGGEGTPLPLPSYPHFFSARPTFVSQWPPPSFRCSLVSHPPFFVLTLFCAYFPRLLLAAFSFSSLCPLFPSFFPETSQKKSLGLARDTVFAARRFFFSLVSRRGEAYSSWLARWWHTMKEKTKGGGMSLFHFTPRPPLAFLYPTF